ncbi:MAG: STAS domain-containing protein [Armatimonadetes bacterium]|nr:STAS domain-containing protein [Armatimonadota bacterium]
MAEVIVQDEGSEITIRGNGELDLAVADEFKSALQTAVASGRQVTVDFRGAHFIDSAILAALAINGKAMFDRGDRLKVLVSEGTHPEYVLEMVGFSEFMQISSSTLSKEA